ncbi:SRPBCC domain-containing protein [Natronosporangium hydrolyticum]|uniref:SRPBCC domain-containing protein n=1 Tax=Natronosporangium hydrolyticum TaxID=2811111 RepID=A0A895YMT9_9ACTN|nr:SRPBCC family protein [Natronosporangium hydrolyticum]QSB15420.1 SRPBCC domain-containing protein [Natronosporangium hydrolyticum]
MTTERLSVRAEIAADPADVYRALTDPAALRAWLTDEVDVSISAGRWRIGGRHVPFGDSGQQQLLAAEPGRELRFAWQLDGIDTVVEIGLTPAGEAGTQLAIGQAPVPDWGFDRASMLDFWVLAAGNLATFVEGRSLARRPDLSRPAGAAAVAELTIAAPVADVFASLTEPDRLNRWIAGGAKVEPRVGGRYDFGWGDEHGPIEIVEYDAPHRLAYSWHDEGWPDTVVRWRLAPTAEGGTQVQIRHEGFVAERPADGYQLGWLNFGLSLKGMHELGSRWRPIQWA